MSSLPPDQIAKIALAQKLDAEGKKAPVMAPKQGSGRYSRNDQFKKPVSVTMPMPTPKPQFKPDIPYPDAPKGGSTTTGPVPNPSSDEAMKKIIAEKAAKAAGTGLDVNKPGGAPSVGTEGPSLGGGDPPFDVSDYGPGFMSPRTGMGPTATTTGMKRGGAVRKKMQTKFASGGSVGGASRRGDGIAQRGKTKGRMC